MSTAALFWLKVAFAVVVVVIGIAGALIPWVLRGRGSSDRTLGLSHTFAGGVLGGAGLIHLLSSGIDNFRAAFPNTAYPLSLLLTGVGFLVILLIESVVMVRGHSHHGPHLPAGVPALQHETGWHPDMPTTRHPLVLLVVLSVHSVILGLALGAQAAVAGAMVVFLAVIAHKGAAAFALGVSYQRAGLTRRRALPELTFFSVTTPAGIILGAGLGLALSGRPDVIFEGIFDSLGAGTFLYIAALDIIKTEFDSPSYHGEKWVATVLGFGLMALLAIWI
jgi:zinc transporter 1/2/3